MKPSNDREAVGLILQGMEKKGYKVTKVHDSEEIVAVSAVEEATDVVMSVDMATVFLTLPNGDEGWIYFVLGNDPEEVACNYTVNLDPDLSSITDPWWE